MLRLIKFLAVFVLVLCCIACEQPLNDPTEPPTNDQPLGGIIHLTPFPRFDVVAAPLNDGIPFVMDSSTDGTNNYYLIDAGFVRNVPLSSGPIISYNGQTPLTVSFTKINVSETSVVQSLTRSVMESFSATTMNEISGRIGVKTSGLSRLLGVRVNAEGNYSRSWGTVEERYISTTDTYTTASYYSESITNSITYTIGNNREAAGDYRLSLIGTCDILFIITTNRDNTALIDIEAVLCARENSQLRYVLEYDVIGGNFGKTSASDLISLPENFYRLLPLPPAPVPQPPNDLPSDIFTDPFITEFKTVRTETKRITNTGRFSQHFDVVGFNTFDINLNTMKQEGYKNVSIFIRMYVRELDDTHQTMFLYSKADRTHDYFLAELQFEHSRNIKDTSWWEHFEDELKFTDISIDKFLNNQFIIRYSTGGKRKTWENRNLQIQLVFNK